MSRESEFRATAARLRASAETFGDATCRQILRATADCWLVLADVEARCGPPTRWEHETAFGGRGVYGALP